MAGAVALLIAAGVAGCHDQPAGDASAGSGSSAPSVSASAASVSASAASVSASATSSMAPSITAGTSPLSAPPVTAPSVTAPVSEQPASAPASQPAGVDATAALQALAALPVQTRASKQGYSRDQFGQAWSDDVDVDGGHNGCDTRNDILRRDITAPQIKPGTQGCVVLAGTLADPYTAQDIAFLRGETTSDAVQIDHVVPLSDAWQTGAQELTAAHRQDFANDPLNLQAVSGPVNDAKGDGDAATWLPPNVAFRCEYVTRQIQVKARYGLWVVPAEHDAMARVLSGCGAAPESSAPEPAAPAPAATAAPAPVQAVTPPAAAGGDVYFTNCAAARAAGAAPLYRGQPGYREQMDGDHDGIACET